MPSPFDALFARINAALPAGLTCSVWHTGGGCHALGVSVGPDIEILAVDADDTTALPETVDGTWFVHVWDADAAAERDPQTVTGPDALVAAIVTLATKHLVR